MATDFAPMPDRAPVTYTTVEWERMYDDHPSAFRTYNPARGFLGEWAFEVKVTTMLRDNPVHNVTITGAYDIAYVSVMAMAREMALMADAEEVRVTLAF